MKLDKKTTRRLERERWMSDGWLDKGTYKYEVIISWSYGPETIMGCRADSERSAAAKAQIWDVLENDFVFSRRTITDVKVKEIEESALEFLMANQS